MADPIPATEELIKTAAQLCRHGHGIIAADESVGTIGKRLVASGLPNDAETRRTLRHILATAHGLEGSISGIILHDETLRQTTLCDEPFAEAIARRGILPGIKVDLGLAPLEGSPRETRTKGLEGLQARCAEYRALGARFAKWRAAVRIDAGDGLPSAAAVNETATTLARYAEAAMRGGLVPIVEPEVLIEGGYDAHEAARVGRWVVSATFDAVARRALPVRAVVVKMMMVTPGVAWTGPDGASKLGADEVGRLTARLVRDAVPRDAAGVVFLSGGLGEVEATQNLNAVNVASRALNDGLDAAEAWAVNLAFSFGRALQTSVVEVWRGKAENIEKAREMGGKLARVNGLAARGEFRAEDGHPSVVGGRGLTETFRGWGGGDSVQTAAAAAAAAAAVTSG